MARSPRGFEPVSVESRRLVDGEATVKERLLLQAGMEEAPPNNAGRRRTLAALGLAVATSTVATSAGAAASVSKAAVFAPAKWLLWGAVGAALAVGTAALVTKPDSAPGQGSFVVHVGQKATISSAAPSTTPSANVLAAPIASPAAQRSQATTPLRGSRSPERAPSPSTRVELSPGPASEAIASPSELFAQVAALDRARSALRAGRAGESLSLLESFDRRYPRSTLAPEATVVRVSALLSLGQRAQATRLVRAYCRSGGRGAYGQRLMALVEISDASCEDSTPRP